MFCKKNREKGMVTIEATIALTAFLFMFLMIYSIVTVCRAQARIQVAINNAAKEISQYSYLYGLTGLDKSLAGFQKDAGDTKSEVNELVKSSIGVFEGIQSLGDEAKEVGLNATEVDSLMGEWESISGTLDGLKSKGEDVLKKGDEVKKKIENMASDPKKLMFGMAKLFASESLELFKSRLIAEPIVRTLVKKHLKRSEDDSADAFCRSVGIVPGTWFGNVSYYNGIDFSSSTLFAYGSPDITIYATYKIKLLELLPVNIEFTITQSASTRGWLHGDASVYEAEEFVSTYEGEESVWNSNTMEERNRIIRDIELEALFETGYDKVSGETIIQAYDEISNTVAMVRGCNPIYGVDDYTKINKEFLVQDIKQQVAAIESATVAKQNIIVKEKDANGNWKKKEIDCSKTKINKKIILVIPQDEGVEALVKSVIEECGYSDLYVVYSKHGTGKKLPEKEGE